MSTQPLLHRLAIIFFVSFVSQAYARGHCVEDLKYFTLPDSGGLTVPYYTYPGTSIGTQNSSVKTLLISIHGTDRDAIDYFCWMYNSVMAHVPSDRTHEYFVIAPAFCIQGDPNVTTNTIYWDNNEYWKDAELSTSQYSYRESSFTVLDNIILYIVKNNIFPNLDGIVIAGHSAGGQFTQRYALLSTIIESVYTTYGIPFRFFPANPSSYVYLNQYRPPLASSYKCNDYCIQNTIISEIGISTNKNWIIPKTTSCDYNDWKFGLQGTLPSYLRGQNTTTQQLQNQYFSRTVIYLAGTSDICNDMYNSSTCETCDDTDLDVTCEAMTQGNCRLQRAVYFWNHLSNVTSKPITHKLILVPDVAHNAILMFNSSEASAYFFLPFPVRSHPQPQSAAGAVIGVIVGIIIIAIIVAGVYYNWKKQQTNNNNNTNYNQTTATSVNVNVDANTNTYKNNN